ncbi:MAG: response regulator [Spirochaetaceae bacterium]|nr:MAG: response regulator [Spirochaetaceae bacterium]
MAFRVLLADDLYFMRMVQKEVLEAKGFEIVGEASTGTEAVARYEELNPDIVILDITMPEMNGLEAMKKIFEFDRNAKIIICSAIGQQNLIVDAINAGIKDFIVKPFKPERLLSAINKALTE